MNYTGLVSQMFYISFTSGVFCNANTNGLELQRGKKKMSETVQDI